MRGRCYGRADSCWGSWVGVVKVLALVLVPQVAGVVHGRELTLEGGELEDVRLVDSELGDSRIEDWQLGCL